MTNGKKNENMDIYNKEPKIVQQTKKMQQSLFKNLEKSLGTRKGA